MATAAVRLTQLSHGAGCACKLPAGSLREVLAALPSFEAADLLIGHTGLDDAAVWRVSDDLAVVQTIDFFTPLVDDPYTFGRIAATNAFSDIYAMGARPAFALNVVAFPKTLPMELLGEILRGGADVARAAGAVVAGGHSIDDPEPKYGMAVTGFVHPDEVWTNGGGREGDVLVLSKRIGTGIVATAVKRATPDADVVDAAVDSMTTLNAEAAEIVRGAHPHAVTDVTGFGLLGHAWELADRSRVRVVLEAEALPLLPGARDVAAAGERTGGDSRNRDFAAEHVTADGVPEDLIALAYDPQTAGGLLVAVAPARAPALESAFAAAGQPLARIGRVEPGSGVALVS
jgi:selenide,water dikinase